MKILSSHRHATSHSFHDRDLLCAFSQSSSACSISDLNSDLQYWDPPLLVFQTLWQKFVRQSTPESRLETHVMNSASLSSSDFEFDSSVSNSADLPLSPKFFCTVRRSNDELSARPIPNLYTAHCPLSTSITVRQLMAAELSEHRLRKEDGRNNESGACRISGDSAKATISGLQGHLKGKSFELEEPLSHGSHVTVRLQHDMRTSCQNFETCPPSTESFSSAQLYPTATDPKRKKWELIKAFLFNSKRSRDPRLQRQHPKSRK